MEKENEGFCNEEYDRTNHFLIEQITRISVTEEEERTREELHCEEAKDDL